MSCVHIYAFCYCYLHGFTPGAFAITIRFVESIVFDCIPTGVVITLLLNESFLFGCTHVVLYNCRIGLLNQ